MKKCEVCGNKINRKEKICPYCNEKPNRVSSSAIKTFILWFIVMGIIGAVAFGSSTSEEDQVNSPAWYGVALYAIPSIATVFKIRKIKRCISGEKQNPIINSIRLAWQKRINPNNDFIVPKTKNRQEVIAEKLLESAKANVDLANTSDDIGLFILWYDGAIADLEKISLLEKSSIKEQAERNLYRLKGETQWHLCDALNRQKERVLSDIKGKYKNSREFQEKQYESFKGDIEELRPRFSNKTDEFAQKCLFEIEKILGINQKEKPIVTHITSNGLDGIDFMDGHQFEYWCANLLRKIGFINVEVTQGSGDQGVDILAEKDGIRYAIQCKCYSSDLGNKPVQEVNTGKAIYHCQIGAVITNRHFTQGGKDAAEATGVLLWDRDWIQEKISELDE